MKKMTRRTALGVTASFFAAPAVLAQSWRKELELCFDCSDSMDTYTFRSPNDVQLTHRAIQLSGHVEALSDPEIVYALVHNAWAVSGVWWSNEALILVPTRIIKSKVDVEQLVEEIEAADAEAPGMFTARFTNHLSLMNFLNKKPGYEGRRRVTDIISDEPIDANKIGDCRTARQNLIKLGTVINCLAVVKKDAYESMSSNLCTFENGGLMYAADTSADFYPAILEKIFTELMF